MSLYYKIDVIAALREKGYTSTRIRKEKLLSESTLQALREGKPISWSNIDALCTLLECQPSDLIEHSQNNSI